MDQHSRATAQRAFDSLAEVLASLEITTDMIGARIFTKDGICLDVVAKNAAGSDHVGVNVAFVDVNPPVVKTVAGRTGDVVLTAADVSGALVASDIAGKADRTELTPLATKAEVTTSLALKADKTELTPLATKSEVTTSLALKADKTELTPKANLTQVVRVDAAQTLTEAQKTQARTNIGLSDSDTSNFETFADGSRMVSQNGSYDVRVLDSGQWGSWNVSGQAWNALRVESGGTGGRTVAEARNNLSVNRLEQDTVETRVKSSDGNRYLYIRGDNGAWGAINGQPLSVQMGGTGTSDVGSIRNNIGAPLRPEGWNWVLLRNGTPIPADGTWAYCVHPFNESGEAQVGVVAGGHVIGQGWTGFAWRIA